MDDDEEEKVLFTKKHSSTPKPPRSPAAPPTPVSSTPRKGEEKADREAPSGSGPSTQRSSISSSKSSVNSINEKQQTPSASPSASSGSAKPRATERKPTATGSSSTKGSASSTPAGSPAAGAASSASSPPLPPLPTPPPAQPVLLDIAVSCRNLSSNSSVVALFEAKSSKSLEYVAHTEGIRHSHHPDFQTHLVIEHRKGTNQKVKFNVYVLPPVHTRVEEKMRIGSAYVYLDEIAANTGLDLLIDLVHGYNAEKDKNNAWLKSHLLIKAAIKDDTPEVERLAKVRATSLQIMNEGRVVTMYDMDRSVPPRKLFLFFRTDSELGCVCWMDLERCLVSGSAGKKGSAAAKYAVPKGFTEQSLLEELSTNVCKLMNIMAIYEGHQTKSFVYPDNPKLSSQNPNQCFSIILSEGSIDIECESRDDREAFMLGIHDILTTQARKEKDAEENQYRFLVKCRNLPGDIQSGGLFVALSSRDTKGLPYEVVNKTGWIASKVAPDFSKAMSVAYISETQSLKFDLFHNSLAAADGVGSALVIFKEMREHMGEMVCIPLRNMTNPPMDKLLQESKAVMLIECFAKGGGAGGGDSDEEEMDEIAEEEDSEDEALEYYGQKIKRIKERNEAYLNSGRAGDQYDDDDDDVPLTLPELPRPPPMPSVSPALFQGYNFDKYAFGSKGCSRKLIFVARDVAQAADSAAASTSVPASAGAPASSSSSSSASEPNAYGVLISGTSSTDKTPDRMRLYWCKPGKAVRSLDSSLRLTEITDIQLGKKTATLLRKDAAKAPEDCCTSLLFGERTLDLVADTPEGRDAFVHDLLYFLLPVSRRFHSWGQCGTGGEEMYEKQMAEHKSAMEKAQKQARRIASGGGGGGGGASNPYAELAGNGDNVNATDMPDLKAAMNLLAKLQDRGMEKLGLDPQSEQSAHARKSNHPDLMSRLAALEDIFEQLDNGGFKGNAAGSGTGGTGTGTGGSGSGGSGGGGGGGHGKGRGGKGTGGGRGDGVGSGSDSDGEGGGGGKKGSGGAVPGKVGAFSPKKQDDEPKKPAAAADIKKLASPKSKGKSLTDDKSDDEDGADLDEEDAALKRTMANRGAKPAGASASGVPDAPVLGSGVPPPPPLGGDFVTGSGPPPPPMGPGAPPPPGPPGAPGAPSFGSSSAAAARARKLKPLHWDALSHHEVGSTIFSNLDRDAFEEGETELDELFPLAMAKKIEARAKSAKGIALIDAKRAYNVEIGISRLKWSNADIRAAIMTLDPEVLTEDKAQILLDRVPTLEELAVLKKSTAPTAELGQVEQFFMMMAQIANCGLRLELHLFRLRYADASAELRRKLKVIYQACKALADSEHLKAVFATVVKVGNYLNAGTRKGNAAGFKLGSLSGLVNLKSSDGKSTALDFIVSYMDRNYKTDQDRLAKTPWLLEMQPVKDATHTEWSHVVEEHRRLKLGLKKIQNIVAAPRDPTALPEDRLYDELTAFYSSVIDEFKVQSTKRLKRIVALEEQIIEYYGEEKSKQNLQSIIAIIAGFTNQFEHAERNLKNYKRAPGAATKSLPSASASAADGTIDPRLNSSFSSMLQGVKLKSKPAHKHLAGGYAGRKTETGQTIGVGDDGLATTAGGASVASGAIDFTFGGTGTDGAAEAKKAFVAPPEFVTASGAGVPMAPPP